MELVGFLAVAISGQVVSGSLKPVAGDLSARSALSKCVDAIGIFGHKVTAKDAGLRLLQERGLRIWRVVLGPPAGSRFAVEVDARTGLILSFDDVGWHQGLDWAVPARPRLANQADVVSFGTKLAKDAGLRSGSSLSKTLLESGTMSRDSYEAPDTGILMFSGPKFRYPTVGTHGVMVVVVRGTGKVVRFTQSYLESPKATAAKIEAAAATAVATKTYTSEKPLASAKPRLVYANPTSWLRNAPVSTQTHLVWEVTFPQRFVYVHAVSGKVVGDRWRHVHPPGMKR